MERRSRRHCSSGEVQDGDERRDQRDPGVRLVELMDDLADVEYRPHECDRAHEREEAAQPTESRRGQRRPRPKPTSTASTTSGVDSRSMPSSASRPRVRPSSPACPASASAAPSSRSSAPSSCPPSPAASCSRRPARPSARRASSPSDRSAITPIANRAVETTSSATSAQPQRTHRVRQPRERRTSRSPASRLPGRRCRARGRRPRDPARSPGTRSTWTRPPRARACVARSRGVSRRRTRSPASVEVRSSRPSAASASISARRAVMPSGVRVQAIGRSGIGGP